MKAWHRFAPLTSLEKAGFLVFGAVMHLFVLGQLAIMLWFTLVAYRFLRLQ